MEKYPKLKELIWCQEEPMNQGAWYAKHHRLERLIKRGQELLDAGRAPLVTVSGRRLLPPNTPSSRRKSSNAALGIKE
jgi:hypothetical protein